MTAIRRPARTAGRRAAGRRGALGARCSWRRPWSAWPCCRPGRSSPRSAISLTKWDLLTAAEVRRPRQLRRARLRRPVPEGAPEHVLLHDRVGAARAGHRARPRAGAQPGGPRHRLHPDRLLPAGRHLDHRRSPSSGSGSTARSRACSTRCIGLVGIPPQKWLSDPMLRDAGDHRDVDLAGPRDQRDHLPGRPPGDPGGAARRGQRRRRRPLGAVPARHPAAADAEPSSSPGVLSLIASFQVFDQIFVLAQAAPDRRDDHGRLLHLRERLQVLQDGLRERGLVGPVPHRRRCSRRSTSGRSAAGCTTSERRRPATVAGAAPGRVAAAPARRLRSTRRAVLIGLLIAGGVLMMVPFLWMIIDVAQDPGRGLRRAADAPPRRSRSGRTTRTCGTSLPVRPRSS